MDRISASGSISPAFPITEVRYKQVYPQTALALSLPGITLGNVN